MQRARLARNIDPIPIVQPKSAIASLLDFRDKQPGSKSMDRTGRNENTIARLRVNRVQALLGLARLNRVGQVLSRNVGFEPCVQYRPGFRVDDVPSLGFA